MNIIYSQSHDLNVTELHAFFEKVFSYIEDNNKFSSDQEQRLDDWFSVEEMLKNILYGALIEARNEDDILIGAIYIAKQNPITWPDGKKMEIFILGVDPDYTRQGIAKELLYRAEQYAKEIGAKKIIINTHVLQEQVQSIYKHLGYKTIGILEDYYDNGNAIFFSKDL